MLSKIALLNAGADDCLTKPFNLSELKVCLRRLLRRATVEQPAKQMIKLLECLLQNAGSVVFRASLISHAWPKNENPWTNKVDVHVKYLRDKIDRPYGSSLLPTVHGVGYKVDVSRQTNSLMDTATGSQ